MKGKSEIQVEKNQQLKIQLCELMDEIDTNINNDKEEELSFNDNILDDLPITQQISIYEESINQMNEKMKYINTSRISELKKEIENNKGILNKLKESNQNMEKTINHHNNSSKGSKNNSIYQKIQLLKEKIETEKSNIRNLRKELKDKNTNFSKLNNEILKTENMITLINDNIDFQKFYGNSTKYTYNDRDITDLEEKIEEVSNSIKREETMYKIKLNKEKENLKSSLTDKKTIKEMLNEKHKYERIKALSYKSKTSNSTYTKENEYSNDTENINKNNFDYVEENIIYSNMDNENENNWINDKSLDEDKDIFLQSFTNENKYKSEFENLISLTYT